MKPKTRLPVVLVFGLAVSTSSLALVQQGSGEPTSFATHSSEMDQNVDASSANIG
jgi:hypothetical protein